MARSKNVPLDRQVARIPMWAMATGAVNARPQRGSAWSGRRRIGAWRALAPPTPSPRWGSVSR
eukprot:3129103-Pyramimonas_sp.AAC.1